MPKRSDFPQGFVFGAATAAYQIEGHAFGNAGSSHWDTFAATGRNVIRNEDGARACEHYTRWPEDLDLIRDAGLDAYRFSTSWARVMPDGVTLNPEGLDFYDRLVDGMVERGLSPYLTLYHWDLPSALADKGGWTNRDTALRFADYSAAVMARIGDRVARTATINEPWCVSWLSHFEGQHAPGLRDIRATARSMHHIQLAHGLAVQRLRAEGHDGLGIVLNFSEILPAGPGEDRAVDISDAISNRWFIESVTRGTYPEILLEGLGRHMPANWQDDMAAISSPIDWLGVNYYSRGIVSSDPSAPWPSTKGHEGPLPKTQMGWEIYPEGLRNLLIRMARDYVGDLPIVVTENGMASADAVENGAVFDPVREGYLASHLNAARQAIEGGANLQGFFYWSLLDNYEWSFGYEKRFGLIHVDFDTMVRTPKSSWHRLKAAMAR
ncbi:beta-glucosidase [Paracoccus aestuarii]|uniref:Beta-glucosidase n=1 Tax=Paracoccus aestuarii TaxID=453842 RepID=A0A419A062_9RHOB|nr:GH1 family beta-glucosidase [Paracoccus aestuarii]RJL06200.1 beta-glucosidase [Paracoccus aestuarii]WCQ98312.1 beta-glucosidase [Paracoccus aestuarii]